ncbi:glycosyltransferase [Mycobacterium attenuatum]|uniref:glycosyltransferase n=1 Tax=Mycobacterium attenuatum TaxID=2341086 RepID=UPI000F031EAA|nr:glycosyltransferase family 2 protein [Mycobacterium attenuatum]VBA56918.1 Poly-beta-1,6-N-acetyl-D-glucosamine synthase [Mycobacterium attenuatum]
MIDGRSLIHFSSGICFAPRWASAIQVLGWDMIDILLAASRLRQSAGGPAPTVAIVIPAYNEEGFIGKCLESCLRQTSPPDEIIVVNNRSTDRTKSIVRRFQLDHPHIRIRLLAQNEYQGIAPTRNCGFDNVRSAVIGRIDADSIISDDWVATIRRRFRDPGLDAVTGPVWYYDMPLQGPVFRLDRRVRGWLHRNSTDQRFLLGANMAIRTSAWRAVRHLTRLDLEDQLHEDVDLAVTLFKNNFRIDYEPALVAGMSGRRVACSTRDFYRYATRYIRTTKAHNVTSRIALVTIAILLSGYFPVRILEFFYDGENNRFTSVKLRDKIRAMTRRGRRHEPMGQLLRTYADRADRSDLTQQRAA